GGASELRDILWLRVDGSDMVEEDWSTGYARTLAVYLNGDAIFEPGPLGQRVRDDDRQPVDALDVARQREVHRFAVRVEHQDEVVV
ncbi:hypothetical protein, partial [Bacillus cereus group sp. Bce020]|uniref:hypothetical protein n=1 Tax=Bacillus cereus group sp. Bce020 TaxID=3445246 RepID=UPI003F21B491